MKQYTNTKDEETFNYLLFCLKIIFLFHTLFYFSVHKTRKMLNETIK